MDSGKILLGIALVVFSAALMVNPSSAAENDHALQVGGSMAVTVGDVFPAESPVFRVDGPVPGLSGSSRDSTRCTTDP